MTAMAKAVITVHLSESFEPFVEAALDLLAAAEDSDDVLVTDDIVDAASRLRAVIDRYAGGI